MAEEEDMLSEILDKTSHERARLDRYRDRVVENGTEVAAITRGGSSLEEKGTGMSKKKSYHFYWDCSSLFW